MVTWIKFWRTENHFFKKFALGRVKYEPRKRHLSQNINLLVGYISLEFRKNIATGAVYLEITNIHMIFKVMEWEGIETKSG